MYVAYICILVGDDLDFEQYPSEERQIEWIKWYFERLTELNCDQGCDVSDQTIQAFKYQANICALVSIY